MGIKVLRQADGSTKCFSRLSGTAGGVNVIQGSGGGWLDSVQIHTATVLAAASGAAAPIVFFDSPIAGSGSPFVGSGNTILANLNATPTQALESLLFNSGLLIPGGYIVKIGARYTTGLSVNGMSGQPGMTVNYTPDFLV